MVREILKILTDNGKLIGNPTFKDIELTEYSAKFPRMGMPSLSATLMWKSPLDNEWTRREYVTLRGERFYIRHTPSSSKSNTDARYRHEINFTSEFAEILGNTYFVDAVLPYASTYDKPCSNNTTFTFYGTIAEFVDRFNCALVYADIGDSILNERTYYDEEIKCLTTLDEVVGDGYCVMLDPYGSYDRRKSYEFKFEDKKLWEVITEGYRITGIPFERRGRRIIFGSVPTVVQHKFEYGHDNELLSVNRNNANAQVINRITMLGSSDNLPHFYPNETEYGHISIAAKPANEVLTTDMVEIANMNLLLSRLNADDFAVLGKYDGEDVGNAQVAVTGYASAFESNTYSPYELNTYLQHNASADRSANVLWHVRVMFKVTQPGVVTVRDVRGNVWNKSGNSPSSAADMTGGIKVERLALAWGGSFPELDLTHEVEKQDSVVNLGYLGEGDYTFQFAVNIPNRGGNDNPITAMCYISAVSVGASDKPKTGYYWAVGNARYDSAETLGVRVDNALTDAMIGDGFGWKGSGRVPFQDHLMPPKYRKTLGEERFYNAIDDTYTDPDTGRKYVFPNPYISGAPSEHIFRDDDRRPTIEGVRNAVTDPDTGLGQLIGAIADIAYDEHDNDVMKPDSEDSDKNDALKYEHSFFYVKLNMFNGDYGFDLFAHASQNGAMTLQMTSGSCNGCKFKIQVAEFEENGVTVWRNPVQTTGAEGDIVAGDYADKVNADNIQSWQQDTQTAPIWVCVQKDAETFGVLMPNQTNGFKPQVGDRFNIINIDLPQGYILAAEQALENDGIRFMSDNNEEKFTFDIQASRIFLAEHPEVMAELDEYSVIRVKYNGKEYEQYVNQLTIDCKDSEALPNIGIDLANDLAVGESFVDNVAERAASLVANAVSLGGGLVGSGGGLSAALAERRYLNKQRSDRTPFPLSVGGIFTAETGAHFGDFVQGMYTGRGGAVDGSGNAEVESIVVRSSMKVMELIYNRLNAQEGDTSFADSGTIDLVFTRSDGSRIAQMRKRWDGDFTAFQPGDIVYGYVNDINRAESKEYYKAWAWIKSVDRANNQLTVVAYPDGDVPSGENHPLTEGMMITRWGNNIEPTLQTYINPEYKAVIGKRSDGTYYNKRQQSFYVSSEQGNIVELMGVNKPRLEGANYGTVLGQIPDGLLDESTQEIVNPAHPYLFARGIIVQDLIRIGYEGLTPRTSNYRGKWSAKTAADKDEYYRSTTSMYDTVTWEGSLWQCLISGTTDEPSDLSPDWVKMTAGVNDGGELNIWTIDPNTNIVSVRRDAVIPPVLSANVVLHSSDGAPTVFTSNLDLYDAGAELWFSADGVEWRHFAIGTQEPLDLEDESGVIELEDSVNDSHILTVGGDDIDTDTIGDRIYFELRTVEDGTVIARTQVPVVKDGQDGEDGADGKDGKNGRDGLMVYPAGNYDRNTAYTATGETMPVVMYNDNYYRLKAGASYSGVLSAPDRDTPAKDVAKNDAQTVWILFDKFDSIFANIIMANFAKLGEAVFYGEWMISQKGIDNAGKPSDDYQDFKDGNFEPNYAVNFVTGEVRAANGVFKGHIEADSGTFSGSFLTKFKSLEDSDAVTQGSGSDLKYKLKSDLNIISNQGDHILLPTDISYVGYRASVANNIEEYTRTDYSTIVSVDDGTSILGFPKSDSSTSMPTSGDYSKTRIRFLTGLVELIALPNAAGNKCRWYITSLNAFWVDPLT